MKQLVAILFVLAGVGCCGPAIYLKQRARDAVGPFRADISVGKGLHANVNATRFLALGAGKCDVRRIGGRRGQWGVWDEQRSDLNLLVPIFGKTTISSVDSGNVERTQPIDWHGISPLTVNDGTRGKLEVSGNLHVLVAGAELGLDFGEMGDFLLGWFGLDPADDDVRDPFEALRSRSPGIRIRGLHDLVVRPEDEALSAIESALLDPEPAVKIEAMKVLMARYDARCVPSLVPLLDDPALDVQTQAAVAISHIDGVRFKKRDKVAEARKWWLKTGWEKYAQ